ncbi:MAG TPA: M48 family metallopeptidase [Terriglobia bacterium]|nr:M48 family metallopeptidase [Terriglobia bacterium]
MSRVQTRTLGAVLSLLVIAVALSAAYAQQNPPAAHTEAAPQHFTLTPEQRARAEAWARIGDLTYAADLLLALAVNLAFWLGRFGVALRNLARRASARLLVQGVIVAPLFVGATILIGLPLDYYSGYVLERRFGLSTQTFASWFGDWGKSLAIEIIAGVVLLWVFYAVVRRSPRRWWCYFWLATIPLALFVMFIEPWVVEPLFYRFTPLTDTRPALVGRIETMLDHAGLQIPRSRIFLMNASSKTTALNAYVSGIGSSKRVVVWDTTLHALTPDETLLVLGHETGHYVLHHIPREFVLDECALLAVFYAGYRIFRALISRFGARTCLEGQGDLASLPLAMLILTVLAFLASPAINGISRHYEHQADQYALEVAYGVVGDPNAAAARAEQILGVIDLSQPDPSALKVFWLYTHPPVEERIRFENDYHPWTERRPLEFVRPVQPRR